MSRVSGSDLKNVSLSLTECLFKTEALEMSIYIRFLGFLIISSELLRQKRCPIKLFA
jgi:hypothetical protein